MWDRMEKDCFHLRFGFICSGTAGAIASYRRTGQLGNPESVKLAIEWLENVIRMVRFFETEKTDPEILPKHFEELNLIIKILDGKKATLKVDSKNFPEMRCRLDEVKTILDSIFQRETNLPEKDVDKALTFFMEASSYVLDQLHGNSCF